MMLAWLIFPATRMYDGAYSSHSTPSVIAQNAIERNAHLEELDTSDGAGGHDTRAMAGLGAPSDSLSFFVPNKTVRVRRAPQAEVC